jgi:hypothetical protein
MAEESDADVGLAPPDQSAAPAAPVAAPTDPGAEGRQITVRPSAPPKPPPKPIAPHPSVPLSVQPKGPVVDAPGQQAPPKEESDADVGIKQPSSVAGDVGKSAWSGFLEGGEGLLGAPTDIKRAADYGLDWATAHARAAVTGEDANDLIKSFQDQAFRVRHGDALADTLQHFMPPSSAQLQTIANQYVPGAGYQPQTGPGRYAHEFGAFAPGALIGSPTGIAGRLAGTILPSIGSETAGHATQGTALEPWARMVGAGFGSAGSMLGGAGVAGGRQLAAPMMRGGPEDLAASQFRAGTQDTSAADQALRNAQAQRQPGMATGENIPGSRPTTGQVTGDLGQLDMERQLQTADPATHAARMADQRAAQSQALGNVTSGAPETVSDMITKRLQDIDAQHELEVGMHQRAHEAGATSLERQARTMTGQVARKGEPEALGEAARKPLVESMAKAKANEKRLWDAIQAHKIGVWTPQISAQAKNIMGKMGMQKPMGGEEKAIFDQAANLPRWTKLSDVTDLTSRLKAEMRNERFTNGNTPALKRMAMLLKTHENIIKAQATRQSAKEAAEQMENLRRMTPEDQAQIMRATAATRARGDIERGPAGAIIRKGATGDSYRTLSSQVPGKVFAAGPTGYQKLKAYTEAAGKPYLDPVHDIVSDSLAREATTDGMVDAGKLQRWQAKYGDALRALPDEIRQKFVSGPGEANEALAEGAAQRREALIANSKLDVAREMGKQAPEAAAMRADPAFKGLEGATSPRDVQKTIGGMFERKDAVATMSRLAHAVSGNPVAADGLKRAVLDHVIEKVTSTAEAGTTGVNALKPGMTQSYLTKNRAVLKAAGFDDAQLANFDKIVADIQRQQRFGATKYPGQSNTAQDIFKHMHAASESGHLGPLGKLFAIKEGAEAVGEGAEFVHKATGIPKVATFAAGALAYPVARKIMKARQAGLAKATDLVHDAVMNPDRAADLLRRPTPGSERRLELSYGRHAMYAGLAGQRTMGLNQPQ